MTIFSWFTCPQKTKQKTPRVSGDAFSMSGDSESSYLEIEHLPATNNVRNEGRSCSVKFCIVVVLVVSVTLNIAGFLYLGVHRGSSDIQISAGLVSALHEDSVCTVCSSLGIQTDSLGHVQFSELSVYTIRDDFSLCCMHNTHGLKTLLSLFADRYHLYPLNEVGAPTQPNRKSTGAHLYVDREGLKLNPPTLSWSKDVYGDGLAYNSNDVLFDYNQLRITKPGLYHIYSFITFKTEKTRLLPDNVLHTINRRNKHLPELGSHVILIDKTTLPEVSEKFLTSFLSATVRLRQDDQLFVEVSNLSYVYKYAPSNFFGLYFVGE